MGKLLLLIYSSLEKSRCISCTSCQFITVLPRFSLSLNLSWIFFTIFIIDCSTQNWNWFLKIISLQLILNVFIFPQLFFFLPFSKCLLYLSNLMISDSRNEERASEISLLCLLISKLGVALAAFSCHPVQCVVTFGIIKTPWLLDTWIPFNYSEICIPKSLSTECHIPQVLTPSIQHT